MNRSRNNRVAQRPKPVERIELSEKYIGLRFVILAVLLVIAVGSFAYGINSLFSVEEGWTEIEANSSAEANVANEFVVMYKLGSREDMSVVEENKTIIALYTDIMENAYKVFHDNQAFEYVNNIYYINHHPNEEIVIDDMLYQAFEMIDEYENRNIYLGPIYAMYDDLFYCEDPSQTIAFDPFTNSEVASSYQRIASFAMDEEMIDVQLLGQNKIKLFVSDVYLNYAKENDIVNYIEFSWMKNAFIIDFLADALIENGYQACTISSYDGFVRNLDNSGTEFSMNFFGKTEENIYQAATMNYHGKKSIVSMRNFPINALDQYSYYVFDGEDVRTLYLDVKDGMCKHSTDSLYFYSSEWDCTKLMLEMIPIYISNNIDLSDIEYLTEDNIYFVCIDDKEMVYNEENISLENVYMQ